MAASLNVPTGRRVTVRAAVGALLAYAAAVTACGNTVEIIFDGGPSDARSADAASTDGVVRDVTRPDARSDAPSVDAAGDALTDTATEALADAVGIDAADAPADGPIDASGKDVADAASDSKDATSEAPGTDAGVCSDGGTPPSPNATYLSDPTATQTSTSTGYVLFKQLNAFPNYGATDDASDVLYTGQVGAWTFSIPTGAILSATVVASMVADDGGTAPVSAYSFTLWSGSCVYASTPGELPHGIPFDSMFSNWTTVTEPANPAPGGSFTVTIQNTSTTSSTAWIAVDWIELVVTTM